MNDKRMKVEPLLTRYIESHEETLPKETVKAYYQQMLTLYEQAGQQDKAAWFRAHLQRYE